jgi:hypothetical protein
MTTNSTPLTILTGIAAGAIAVGTTIMSAPAARAQAPNANAKAVCDELGGQLGESSTLMDPDGNYHVVDTCCYQDGPGTTCIHFIDGQLPVPNQAPPKPKPTLRPMPPVPSGIVAPPPAAANPG